MSIYVHIIGDLHGEFTSSLSVNSCQVTGTWVHITLESSESLVLAETQAGPGAGGEPELLTERH